MGRHTLILLTTLKFFLNMSGYKVTNELNYEYMYEDSLVLVAEKSDMQSTSNKLAEMKNIKESRVLLEKFKTRSKRYLEKITAVLEKSKENVVIFGGGHQAIRFIHLNNLSDKIEAVIDDDPAKLGAYIPGTQIPIISSSRLNDFSLCLLALSLKTKDNKK